MKNFDGEQFRKELLEIYPNMYLVMLQSELEISSTSVSYNGPLKLDS